MATGERIHGRDIGIVIDEEPGFGWKAIGIVQDGPHHERGMRFEARGADPDDAERRLKLEIEAAFA